MLRNVFIAVATKYPEMHDEKSRAVYGIDIMIDSLTMEPKLLEITFSPDCKRACEYYPTFYDDVFHTLFLETMSQNMERIILDVIMFRLRYMYCTLFITIHTHLSKE